MYLSIADAAVVAEGGQAVLTGAIGDESVPVRTDVRTGESIVMALDLRRAGLLKEHVKPHGIQKNTAKNVLRDLKLAVERGAKPPAPRSAAPTTSLRSSRCRRTSPGNPERASAR